MNSRVQSRGRTRAATSRPRARRVPNQNVSPITAALRSTSRSSGARRSRRAWITASTVSGISRVPRSPVGCQLRPSRASRPRSARPCSSSSTNSGTPSLRSAISAANAAGTPPPVMRSTSCTVAARDSGASSNVSWYGRPRRCSGAVSDSSGRARPRTKTGQSPRRSRTQPSASRLAASAHCRSSSTRTTGSTTEMRRSRSRRIEPACSTTGCWRSPASSETPSSTARARATSSTTSSSVSSSVSSTNTRSLRAESACDSSAWMPTLPRSRSAHSCRGAPAVSSCAWPKRVTVSRPDSSSTQRSS
jgi:hypothetical protein